MIPQTPCPCLTPHYTEHGVLKDQWEPRLLHSAPPGGYRTGSESWINQISGGSWLRFSRSSSEDAIRCNAAVFSKLQVIHVHYSCLHVSSLSQCNNPGLRRVHKDGRCETCRGALFLLSFTEPVVLCSICHSGGKYCKTDPNSSSRGWLHGNSGEFHLNLLPFSSPAHYRCVCMRERERERNPPSCWWLLSTQRQPEELNVKPKLKLCAHVCIHVRVAVSLTLLIWVGKMCMLRRKSDMKPL